MFCWNETRTLPGLTLSDATGERRIQKLLDSRVNIQLQVLEMLDQIQIIDNELVEMHVDYEMQTPILDLVMPVSWRQGNHD